MARRSEFRTPRGTRLPTTRTQFARHVVPEVQSERAGLENMGSIFRSFFNDVTESIGNVQEAVNYGRVNEIKAENSREAAQGAQDAFAGRRPNPALERDMDYMDAFRGITGQRLGRDLANSFNEAYLEWRQENPHGDVEMFREQWALENGIDAVADPEIAAAAADQFLTNTDPTVRQHGEDSFTIRQNEDLQTMGAEIAAEVADGTLTVDRIKWYVSAAEQIDPLNPQQAAPRVIARLLEGAQQFPGRSEQIMALLEQPDTGVNGQSFAESFPEAYNSFQEGALTRYLQENSLAENELFNSIEEDISVAGSFQELNDALLRLTAGHGIYGNGRRYQQLRNAAAQKFEEFAQTAADLNNMAGMLQGMIPQDPSFMREHFMDFFEAANGTRSILEADPAMAAAQIAATNGAVPTDVRHQLSAALLNSSDPAVQEQAFQILNGISEARDGNISSYLSEEATRFWNNIGARRATGASVNQIITEANTNRSQGISPQDVDWMEVTGTDTSTEANDTISSWITEGVNNYLGTNGWFDGDGDVSVAPNVRRQIENYARMAVAEGMAVGRDPETVFNEAIAEVMANVSVGGTVDEPVLFIESSADTGPDGKAPIRLGFNVTSPYNGTTVNTREIYATELEQMSEAAPWITPDGNFDDVRVRPSASSPGRYEVLDSTGANIQFSAEEGITWDGINYSFNTEDPEEIEQMFQDVIPEGFGFERVDTLQGPGWRLMYQPHVGEEGRRTVEDAAEDFGYNGESTPEQELENLQAAAIAAQREAGLTQPGAGVGARLAAPESGQDILDMMEDQMWRGVSWNGRNTVNRARTGQASYRTARREMFTGAEGIQTASYDGPNGNRRVGIGFNMDRENARETWEMVFGDEVDFDAVRNGEEELTQQQARDLFDYDMNVFEEIVSDVNEGVAMPEHRHLSLVSLAHSNPEFVQGELAELIRAGNHSAVIEAILDSGAGASGAMAARRYREAAQYAGSDRTLQALIPSPEEYLRTRSSGSSGTTTGANGIDPASSLTTSAGVDLGDDPEFLQGVNEVSERLGMDPAVLLAVMDFETGGTFSQGSQNSASTASGLIGFMEQTVEGDFGLTIEEVRNMTRMEQLDLTERFLQRHAGNLNTIEDAYMAVLWPAAVGKSNDYVLFASGSGEYDRNSGLDSDGSGTVTKAEAAAFVRRRYEDHYQGATGRRSAGGVAVGEGPMSVHRETRATVRPTPDRPNFSMDFNSTDEPFARGTEVIVPDNASPEVVEAARQFNIRVREFAARHGIEDYPIRDRGRTHGGGVITRTENGRGADNTIHLEPFFAQDPEMERIVQENAAEFAAIFQETFGHLPGNLVPPHGVGRDRGAVSSTFGNETSFGELMADTLLQQAGSVQSSASQGSGVRSMRVAPVNPPLPLPSEEPLVSRVRGGRSVMSSGVGVSPDLNRRMSRMITSPERRRRVAQWIEQNPEIDWTPVEGPDGSIMLVSNDYIRDENGDYIRGSLDIARQIAEQFGARLPSDPAEVDAIARAATVRPGFHASGDFAGEFPNPDNFESLREQHTRVLAGTGFRVGRGDIAAGHFKTVMDNGGIYLNGIQPFAVSHGSDYADYSQGIRLIAPVTF